MSATQIFILLLFFVAVTGGVFGLMYFFRPMPTQNRLRLLDPATSPVLGAGAGAASDEKSLPARITRWLRFFGRYVMPEEGWENSALRTRFMNAGFRSEAALLVYFGAKLALALALPGLAALQIGMSRLPMTVNSVLLIVLALAAVGYFIPNVYLAQRIRLRKRDLFESLPDALDLMTVCVEAGLAMDAAISRVADEIRMRSVPLADELHLAKLELRAGATRERALRNMALRTGVEDIDALVAMLVQTERFGTSVADSLRVHAEGLRLRRRLLAEEAAAKIPVKLLLPLIFCIFPTLLLVLLGPALIAIYRALLPTFTG